MRFSSRRRRPPAINIISLIDILTILLIFFGVTTVFKKEQPQVEIKLPEHTEAIPAKKDPPLLISVSADSKVYIGKDEIALEKLKGILLERKKNTPDFKAALRADRNAPFGVIIKVMEAGTQAGLKDLPTFTDKPAEPGAP
jgi:biopolymer transport protein ExbD